MYKVCCSLLRINPSSQCGSSVIELLLGWLDLQTYSDMLRDTIKMYLDLLSGADVLASSGLEHLR